MTPLVVALGDSFSCGEGVGLRVCPSRTWVSLLAGALDARLACVARPGARVADVVQDQLDEALGELRRAPAAGALVTLLMGLNDVASGGFDAARLHGDLGRLAAELRGSGARLLLVRLHDPCRVAAVPPPLRDRVRRRVDAVNAVVDTLPAPGDAVVDLGALPQLRCRGAWAVDRLHPSETGHAAMAVAALRALRVPAGRLSVPSPGRAPSWPAEAAWTLRHGLPWLLTHLGRVAPALLAEGAPAVVPPGGDAGSAAHARVAAAPACASRSR